MEVSGPALLPPAQQVQCYQVGWGRVQSRPEHLQEQTSHHLSEPLFLCLTTLTGEKKIHQEKF